MTRYEAIFRRKSVRKYTNEEIDGWTLERIERFGMDAISVRPDIRVKWHIFRAADQKLKGMFQVKAPYYAALYSEICEDYQENAGCLMEQFSLYLHTLGIGSCYQGAASLKDDSKEDLELVIIMAFGYPAEPLERDWTEFKRLGLKKLVRVHGTFEKFHRKLLEAARLAPSVLNMQPWRFVTTENRIHLFVKKPNKMGYRRQLDMNLFGAGIALSHILLTAEEFWLDLEYQKLDSIMEKDFQSYLYVGSLVILSESKKI